MIEDLAHIIELAVAPVFLLTGIAAFLTMLSGRLGRITDRARVLESRLPRIQSEESQQVVRTEIHGLWRRIRMINRAIGLCTVSALLISIVVILLFVGEYISTNLTVAVGALFVLAMSSLVAGLLLFMREIGIATRSLKMGMESLFDEQKIEG